MQDLLRELFESLGFSGVATFIASGNVAFNAGERQCSKRRSRRNCERFLGYDVAVFIRADADLKEIASFAFPTIADPRRRGVNIVLLADALTKGPRKRYSFACCSRRPNTIAGSRHYLVEIAARL